MAAWACRTPQRLKTFEDENRRLKKLLAESMLNGIHPPNTWATPESVGQPHRCGDHHTRGVIRRPP